MSHPARQDQCRAPSGDSIYAERTANSGSCATRRPEMPLTAVNVCAT